MAPAGPMREIVERLSSTQLGNERTVWIREPADPATARHLTAFLDAELYRDRVGAAAMVEKLASQQVVADSWFVFVSAATVEARWVECPCHPPFARFVAEELLPWLARRFPAMVAVRDRVLVGLSYTGLAAAYIARECPGLFQKIIAQSGSFWWNDCRIVELYRNPPRRLPTAFFLDVGTKETATNVRHREDVLQVVSQIEGVRAFRDELRRQGHAVEYAEFDGGHEAAGWRSSLPQALRWALGRDEEPEADGSLTRQREST